MTAPMTHTKQAMLELADKLAAVPLDQSHSSWPTVQLRLSETERELATNVLRRYAPAPVLGAGAREALEHAKVRFECLAEDFEKAGDETSWAMCSVDAERMDRALAGTVTDTAQGQPEITKGVRHPAQGAVNPVAWRYQRKVGWGDIWRCTTVLVNLETPDDWIVEPLYALPSTGLPAPAPHAEPEDEYNPAYDEGITYAIRMLADLTGSKDWQMKDGSEDHETDVRDTIMDVLKCAGLYDDENGKFATLPVKPLWDTSWNRNYEPVETLAAEIYDGFVYGGPGQKPAWYPHGNGLKQDEARFEARQRLRDAGHIPAAPQQDRAGK